MSKILIHSLVFSPDGVSTAYLYNDIALRLKQKGYEVAVLTTTPHYNRIESELSKQPLKRKCLGLYFESEYRGITVKHVFQKKFNCIFLRMVEFFYWHVISFFLGLLEKNVDVILSPSPPLTIGVINILLAKMKGCRVIYNVQEIYPDLLIQKSRLNSKLIISSLQSMERFVYNNSNAVTTIDQIFFNTIVKRFKDTSKLAVIPNFVDTAIYRPVSLEENILDESCFPQTDDLKLMYAGNIGYAQDWETFIELAVRVKKERIQFFIIGEGVQKEFLQRSIAECGLDRVHVIPYQPRELMPALIAYSDLQFIFMSSSTEGHGFPSKVYTIMACAKPMIICSGEKTPIVEFLRQKHCSFLVTDRDLERKVDVMTDILRRIDRAELETMGYNGLEEVKQNYAKEVVTDKYVTLINSLIN